MFPFLLLVMIVLHSSMPDSFSIPEDLVGKLQTVAKKQRKTAEELLLEIVREYIEVQEFLQRKLSAKASQPKRPPKVL